VWVKSIDANPRSQDCVSQRPFGQRVGSGPLKNLLLKTNRTTMLWVQFSLLAKNKRMSFQCWRHKDSNDQMLGGRSIHSSVHHHNQVQALDLGSCSPHCTQRIHVRLCHSSTFLEGEEAQHTQRKLVCVGVPKLCGLNLLMRTHAPKTASLRAHRPLGQNSSWLGEDIGFWWHPTRRWKCMVACIRQACTVHRHRQARVGERGLFIWCLEEDVEVAFWWMGCEL